MKTIYRINEDGQTQGWAYTTYLHTFMKSTYLINQIYVLPNHRGKGVGTQLLKEMTEHADWENAVLVLDFQPAEFQSDAVRLQLFYERFGFTWDESIGGMRRIPNT